MVPRSAGVYGQDAFLVVVRASTATHNPPHSEGLTCIRAMGWKRQPTG
ncbi:MAG: hypothetical protein V2A54_13040 [Bacteroidota bacterium]